MAKSSGRPPRAVVIQELEALIAQGRSLAQKRVLKVQDLAEATIARLEWNHAATRLLTFFPKGGVQAYADFMRAAGQPHWASADALDEQATHHQKTFTAQLDALEAALTQLKNARTKPLKI